MSGDPLVDRLILRSELLDDIAVCLTATAVVYRHAAGAEVTTTILATIASKMELKSVSLRAEAKEMAR